MDLWFAALLGLVQGLTEFLPISSTAHLRIAPVLVGQPDAGAAFSAVIQLGTLVAVVGYFARDLFIDMPKALFTRPRSREGQFPLYLIAGTIPIVVFGLSLKEYITGDLRSLWVVGSALIAVGLIMAAADRRAGCTRAMTDLRLSDAMWIGLAQSMALVPGVSRSGATITAALILGMRRDDAARFSFLLGVPAIAGAGLFELKDALAELGDASWGPLLVGTAVAAISGYASIAWLLKWLGTRTLGPFCVYRVVIGGLLLLFTALGVFVPDA